MVLAVVARIEGTLAKGKRKDAVIQAERALAEGVRHPLVLRTLAEARMDAGRFAEAGSLLNQALTLDRADPDSLTALGVLLIREGRADEAVGVLSQALRLVPTHYPAWLALGMALQAKEEDEGAVQAFTRAAALDPSATEPLSGLAEIAMRQGRAEDALAAARLVLQRTPAHAAANIISGRVALSSGDAGAARKIAEDVLVRGGLRPFDRISALKLQADALDKLDRLPEAVTAYDRMNQAAVALHRSRFGPGGTVENHFDFMERLGRGYREAGGRWTSDAPPDPPGSGRPHVFVLGYFRAGNTLAAALLGALPGVKVLEERPTLLDADLAFLRHDGDLARLAALPAEEAEALRALYWTRVRTLLGQDPEAGFVDMSPLNGIKIPMIRKLFPKALIVVCRRDPRDVVLSCWRQSFSINAATYQMTDLEGAARHYCAAMTLMEMSLRLVDGPVHTVDYEHLMVDFEGGARALVEAAGLAWSDEVLNFAKAAQTRALRTASAGQIRGGLFDGRRQWRRYEPWMRTVLPLLQPWVTPTADGA